MRPIYGCLEKNWGVLDSTATFAEIFNGLGPFVPIDEYECRTKFEDRNFTRP